jgi:hypothetical protein
MKKGLFAIAGMFLLFSCNEAATDSVKTGDDNNYMAEANRNSEHNREIYKAIESGDVSKLDSFIAKDVIDHDANNGKDIVGIDSLKYFLGNIHNYFDGLKMEMISEATSLDKQYHFAMVRMTGTAKQNPWGMPVGMKIDDLSMDAVKIRDEKATEHWSFTSQKDMMEMMSAMNGGNMMPMKKDSTNK